MSGSEGDGYQSQGQARARPLLFLRSPGESSFSMLKGNQNGSKDKICLVDV